MNKIYDIAIVGGGIAGLSLASSLLHAPLTRHLSIALIEGNGFPKFDKDSPVSNRTSSLTPTSVRYLQSSTGWDHILHDRIHKYVDMHVYDGISDQQIEFHESSEIATMIENFNLQSGLLKALASTGLETFHAKVDSIARPVRGESLFPQIQLNNKQSIKARLLVGADGANSPVRHYANIASHGWDYPHHGVVGTLTHTSTDHSIAHQRMLPSGPIAFLPLPDKKASMVWSIHPRHANTIKSLPPSTTVNLINAAFRLSSLDLTYILSLPHAEIDGEVSWRLSLPSHSRHAPPEITNLENLASFPLKFRHASSYHGDRSVLIGDAAHTIHPLAGQGLNLALLDSSALSTAVAVCVEVGGDVGDVGKWVSRERYWSNARTGGVVDKLHKLYAREEKSIVAMRSFGSGVLDRLGFAKRAVMAAVG